MKDVLFQAELIQEVVVPNTAGLGFLGAAVVAALISRHDSLEILHNNRPDIAYQVRVACAQQLQQQCARICGDIWTQTTLASRVQKLLRPPSEEEMSIPVAQPHPQRAFLNAR